MTILSEQGGPQVREGGWESGSKVAFWQAPPSDDVYHPFGGGPGAGGREAQQNPGPELAAAHQLRGWRKAHSASWP